MSNNENKKPKSQQKQATKLEADGKSGDFLDRKIYAMVAERSQVFTAYAELNAKTNQLELQQANKRRMYNSLKGQILCLANKVNDYVDDIMNIQMRQFELTKQNEELVVIVDVQQKRLLANEGTRLQKVDPLNQQIEEQETCKSEITEDIQNLVEQKAALQNQLSAINMQVTSDKEELNALQANDVLLNDESASLKAEYENLSQQHAKVCEENMAFHLEQARQRRIGLEQQVQALQNKLQTDAEQSSKHTKDKMAKIAELHKNDVDELNETFLTRRKDVERTYEQQIEICQLQLSTTDESYNYKITEETRHYDATKTELDSTGMSELLIENLKTTLSELNTTYETNKTIIDELNEELRVLQDKFQAAKPVGNFRPFSKSFYIRPFNFTQAPTTITVMPSPTTPAEPLSETAPSSVKIEPNA